MPSYSRSTRLLAAVAMTLSLASPVLGQETTLVHRLGKDTMAVEQYTRTANRLVGEVVSRQGVAVTRLQYEVTLRDGAPVSAVYRQRTAAGAPIPNQASEIRLTFTGDSVKREAQFADSTNVRTLPAARGTPLNNPAYGLYEIPFAQMRRTNASSMTVALVNLGGGTPPVITLTAGGGDTIRSSTGVVYRADRTGKLLSVDAFVTTQKIVSTPARNRVDLNALASSMKPTGVLSARGNARASFLQSVVFIDYGRPLVRERTVWGGLLVPPDTIWRNGANEATHLATSRELLFGDVVVPPGLYTLWIFNASSGPQLVINKQVGQWGTVYSQANDLARVPLQLAAAPAFVEEYTITVRNLGGPRGAMDFAWGDKVATATFVAR